MKSLSCEESIVQLPALIFIVFPLLSRIPLTVYYFLPRFFMFKTTKISTNTDTAMGEIGCLSTDSGNG